MPYLHRRLLSSTILSSVVVLSMGIAATAASANTSTSNLPTGTSVVAGSVRLSTSANGKTQTYTQTSNNAVLDHQSYNVGAGYTVNYNQITTSGAPNPAALTVDRVTGIAPSVIAGSIHSNGELILVNPNGLLFTNGAQINAQSLIATTSSITNADAMAGRLTFTGTGASPTASVVNRGTITVAQGGLVALVAPGVENSGTINATLGQVALASGNKWTLDLYGDKLIKFATDDKIINIGKSADGKALAAAVNNSGKINVDAGRVQLTVNQAKQLVDNSINMSGVIQASSATQQGGSIILDAGNTGSVSITGGINASGTSGGNITVNGSSVIHQGAIRADGNSGAGGNINVNAVNYTDTKTSIISASGFSGGLLVNGGAVNTQSGNLHITSTGTDDTNLNGTVNIQNGSFNLNSGGKANINGEIISNSFALTSGKDINAAAQSKISGNNITLTSAGDTNLNGAIHTQGGDVTLISGGAANINGTVETIKGNLNLTSTGDANLNGTLTNGFQLITSKNGSINVGANAHITSTTTFNDYIASSNAETAKIISAALRGSYYISKLVGHSQLTANNGAVNLSGTINTGLGLDAQGQTVSLNNAAGSGSLNLTDFGTLDVNNSTWNGSINSTGGGAVTVNNSTLNGASIQTASSITATGSNFNGMTNLLGYGDISLDKTTTVSDAWIDSYNGSVNTAATINARIFGISLSGAKGVNSTGTISDGRSSSIVIDGGMGVAEIANDISTQGGSISIKGNSVKLDKGNFNSDSIVVDAKTDVTTDKVTINTTTQNENANSITASNGNMILGANTTINTQGGFTFNSLGSINTQATINSTAQVRGQSAPLEFNAATGDLTLGGNIKADVLAAQGYNINIAGKAVTDQTYLEAAGDINHNPGSSITFGSFLFARSKLLPDLVALKKAQEANDFNAGWQILRTKPADGVSDYIINTSTSPGTY